ncbi:MAG: hypothetical protein NTV88_02375, partial [Candidatus Micrarchaeota archaeon]|nr:hypothetical protein [Candidatus Micrarchaeota archaeon]
MRFSLFVLAFVAAAIGFAGLAFASGSLPVPTGNCVDGTPYGACSSATPGQYCTGTQGNLVLGPNIKTCPCEKYFGWKQQGTGDDATCVQTKCTDGTESGACSSTKPQQCVAGALIDNATKCGCLDPTKQQISANGQTCEYKPCSDGTKDGICSSKAEGKKCVQGSLVDKASDCPCTGGYTKQGETCVMLCEDGTKAGECT